MSASRCFACGGENDRAPQRNCRACHAAYQREWRKKFIRVPREAYEAMLAELQRLRRRRKATA